MAQGTHTFTRDEIPGLIEGKTRQATKIARAIRNNEIELNFMSDRWFEEYLGVENNINGIAIKKICLRKNKNQKFSDLKDQTNQCLFFECYFSGLTGINIRGKKSVYNLT
ncbi:MAG: hypothetical protein K2G55_15730 [Lachnospiraceae bacterium]|nr:hypothetical protein [Lachnospiraceae bacterium]MDE7201374.1 hypothetical protein [Lachnospiraceae bacterium]